MLLDENRIILNSEGKDFLKDLRIKRGLPKSFRKSYRTILCWENGRNNPTLSFFKRYISNFDLTLEYFIRNKLIREVAISARELAIQKTTKIKKEKHDFLVQDSNNGLTLERISKKYGCTPSNVFYILRRCNIDTAKHGSGENYHFPESNYISYLKNIGINSKDAIPLISSLLFTDGSLYQYKRGFQISYYGTDKVLHNIFADLIWYCFGLRPSSYLTPNGSVLRTKYIDKNFAHIMLALSPTYKTKPAHKETWMNFLNNPIQPSIKFLKNYDNRIIQEFIRLAMCADGCISVSNKNKKIFFTLILACAHPRLVNEWSEIFNRVGINNTIVKGSGKTKIGGVKGIKDCLSKFYGFGGFIDDVGVCVKHSPLYKVEKQKILSTALRLLNQYDRLNTIPVPFNEFKKLL